MKRIEEDVARKYDYKIVRDPQTGEITGFVTKDDRRLEQRELQPILNDLARARELFVSTTEQTRNKGKGYNAVSKAIANNTLKNVPLGPINLGQ
jgi:hypothetical protein